LLKNPECKKRIHSIQWKFSMQTLFSGQAQVAQKSWKIKIFQCNEKFQGKLCFSGQAKLLKKWCEWYKKHSIQWIQGKLCFSGQAQSCSISPWMLKNIINTVKNFRANSVFQDKRKLFEILNDKKYILNTVNSGHTLFFRASTSYSKILHVKSISNTVKNIRANSVFQCKRKLLKNPER